MSQAAMSDLAAYFYGLGIRTSQCAQIGAWQRRFLDVYQMQEKQRGRDDPLDSYARPAYELLDVWTLRLLNLTWETSKRINNGATTNDIRRQWNEWPKNVERFAARSR